MITCTLEFHDDVEDLYKLFLSEKISSGRGDMKIKKGKSLFFEINAKDLVTMKIFLNSILKVVETYNKVKAVAK